MPYASDGRIATAIGSLQRFHAFFGVTFLSMKKSGVGVGSPVAWGQSQENELLGEYYSPAGAPPDKPYFVPFKAPRGEYSLWKNPKYSGGTLQRARTTDRFKPAFHHPSPENWAFVDDYVSILSSLLPTESGAVVKLPVFDLAAWLYRDRELPNSLSDIETMFRSEFSLSDHEYSALFDNSPEDVSQFFFSAPIDRDEMIALVGGVPDGPSLGPRTEEDLVSYIERWLESEELLRLPDGFVRAFYSSLKAQRFAVLTGRPGTGKTAFARGFSHALGGLFPGSVRHIEIAVAQDFSEADVIGYEKIAGDLAATELTRKLFLDGRPRDMYMVVLDEMNLAQVDYYLARLLPAIESDAQIELPGEGDPRSLPPDAYFIGTVNSYLEEGTRLPLSGPVKRRANVIEMPNYLDDIIGRGDRGEFRQVVIDLLAQTQQRVDQRAAAGMASVLDPYRKASLSTATSPESPVRDVEFIEALWRMCEACSSTSSLTLGVLQDVLDYVAMANDEPMRSLDRQIAQKIAPQLTGPASVVHQLLALIDEIEGSGHMLPESSRVLNDLLRSEDPGSGLVVFKY